MLGREGLTKVHPELRVFIQELSGRMGIKKKVEIDLPVAAFEREIMDEEAFKNEYIFAATFCRHLPARK